MGNGRVLTNPQLDQTNRDGQRAADAGPRVQDHHGGAAQEGARIPEAVQLVLPVQEGRRLQGREHANHGLAALQQPEGSLWGTH